MPICVSVLPAGSVVGVLSGPGQARLAVPMIGVDSSCASGHSIYSQQEIDQLKQTLTVDTASNPERVLDMQAVFYGFLLVLVTVWGVKHLLNLFTGDTDRG